jgi:hypothetical protein
MEMLENKLQKRTLLYLASGEYIPDYENLPYAKVILVDKSTAYRNSKLPLHSKCEFWNMDALEAVDEIAQKGLVIDCVVSVNEGLQEGGGDYVIFSEFMMGYLSPFLADELLVITDLAYYGAAKVKNHVAKMDWGFEKIKRLTPADVDYINPSVFSYARRLKGIVEQTGYGDVFLLRRTYHKVSKKIGKLQLHLIHGSIWQDRHQLDAIGLSIPEEISSSYRTKNQTVKFFFATDTKTFSIRNLSIIEILERCQQNNTFRVGISPWNDGAYTKVFEALKSYRGEQAFELSFYHLNKADYHELYPYFGAYFLFRYPRFFEHLMHDNILWSTFDEVLNKGYGSVLLKLCEQIALYTKQNKTTFHFTQIKIKLGKLRIYHSSKDSFIKGMIRMAEEL